MKKISLQASEHWTLERRRTWGSTICASALTTGLWVAAILAGCTAHVPPVPTDDAAMAATLSGAGAQGFLRQVTAHQWGDEGEAVAARLRWIPRDADSPDKNVAIAAGRGAHAIAAFTGDERVATTAAPPNDVLWLSFSASVVPYLGAAVGDSSGVQAFSPLDDVNSSMRRTVSMFAAMTKDADADRLLTEAALRRAQSYEKAFATALVRDPNSAAIGHFNNDLLSAARLRSLVDTGAHVADPQAPGPIALHAMTGLAFEIASLTVKTGDPYIDPKFFGNHDQLLSQDEISKQDWSIYDSQLTVYLSRWPEAGEAIRRYGDAYQIIAIGQ